MNTKTPHTDELDPLASLFAAARDTQPSFVDDNFTKVLMNSLPSITLVATKANAKKGLSFDLMGAIIGIVLAYFFITRNTGLESLSNAMPDSIVLSPLLAIAAVGAVAISGVVAWWAVEDNRL